MWELAGDPGLEELQLSSLSSRKSVPGRQGKETAGQGEKLRCTVYKRVVEKD